VRRACTGAARFPACFHGGRKAGGARVRSSGRGVARWTAGSLTPPDRSPWPGGEEKPFSRLSRRLPANQTPAWARPSYTRACFSRRDFGPLQWTLCHEPLGGRGRLHRAGRARRACQGLTACHVPKPHGAIHLDAAWLARRGPFRAREGT